MPEGSILSDDFIRELISVGEVDIVVGLPTYNDGRTVGQVVQAIRTGLLKYFPRERVVIINADGGSRDGTQDLVRAASISDLRVTTDVRALREMRMALDLRAHRTPVEIKILHRHSALRISDPNQRHIARAGL